MHAVKPQAGFACPGCPSHLFLSMNLDMPASRPATNHQPQPYRSPSFFDSSTLQLCHARARLVKELHISCSIVSQLQARTHIFHFHYSRPTSGHRPAGTTSSHVQPAVVSACSNSSPFSTARLMQTTPHPQHPRKISAVCAASVDGHHEAR
ncbi:hypothetical protein BKA81DRAFT_155167 [Phyllosticta paracitricarpa]